MALHWAASAGHVEVVKYLLEQGTEVDARDEVRTVMYTGGYGNVLCTDVSAISLEVPFPQHIILLLRWTGHH